MIASDYLSWDVIQFINEYGDEIEMDIIHYPHEYQITVNICDEQRPYRDITATATHPRSKKQAAKKAMIQLYKQAYPELFNGNKW
ncbi:hypothetical protein QNH36_22495 [Mesobacillus sp. AQ2]|uniref:hypothetical protein n=1 Tax=Mesobacillus sp. AQ2 TaxID=3043332 RepID=UPI0024C128D1|nr:hypothetical protein [Mesobacillus sp. AQ2]WHX40377.1 hypothetical protein QNH36_22495 [Mesobacillus sp. AQ2]